VISSHIITFDPISDCYSCLLPYAKQPLYTIFYPSRHTFFTGLYLLIATDIAADMTCSSRMRTRLTTTLLHSPEVTIPILDVWDKNILSEVNGYRLANRSTHGAPERRAQCHYIDVLLSTTPVQIVCRKVPLAIFFHARVIGNIARYIVHLPDKTMCLILPATECESAGVRTVVS